MREKYSVYLALATGCLVFLLTGLFALLQSPEILTASLRVGVAMPHPVAGKEQCDTCHGSAKIKPYPVRHLGWSNGSCTRCHPSPDMLAVSPKAPVPDSMATVAPQDEPGNKSTARQKASLIPHPVKGYEECSSCHNSVPGSIPAPPNHAGWNNESCKGCHIRGGEESK